jgi:gamma-glutamylcyclotransferase (GGCT)/AIG2-like uncharacterized protein YtfP
MLIGDYRKFAKESFSSGERFRRQGPEYFPEAFRHLWETYENALNYLDVHHPGNDNMRNRNETFESYVVHRGIRDDFIVGTFGLPEAESLADLDPMIFQEGPFQRAGTKDASSHHAFRSDFHRFSRGGCDACKAPLTRLLNLLYIVRCNVDHGQKSLPQDWPETRQRNLQIFKLVTPIVHRLAMLLFETVLADGLFAYGTLRPDGKGHDVVHEYVQQVLNGYYVIGKVIEGGGVTTFDVTGNHKVQGNILTTDRLHLMLRAADSYEGERYQRSLVWSYSRGEQDCKLVWIYSARPTT